ncbi:MAG: 5'/3'-nucleotidase SurE [Bacteroidia bacterium]|nr:5'/3'-nucleotidase SurE [Bacteroidia bacterium]
MKKRPSILISNDDGITAPGIRALMEVALEFGDVTVVAPDSPQSGMGHAITIGSPLRLRKQKLFNGQIGYACSGTPVDCVKLARAKIMDHVPDLVISGINHGPNYSISVVYSGTMSAAMEGAIEGIPSIGFSLNDFRYDADFGPAKEVARILIERALHNPMPEGTLLNVNIPNLPFNEMKGIKVTRQAIGRWVEQFDERIDPHGQKYYWLTGEFKEDDQGEDHDTWALRNGFVSVCPVEFDLTAHHSIPFLNRWGLTLEGKATT